MESACVAQAFLLSPSHLLVTPYLIRAFSRDAACCYRFHHESLLNSGSPILWTQADRVPELQGQATKNQDLLVASGAISLKGSEGLSAVDDDIQAAVSSSFGFKVHQTSPQLVTFPFAKMLLSGRPRYLCATFSAPFSFARNSFLTIHLIHHPELSFIDTMDPGP